MTASRGWFGTRKVPEDRMIQVQLGALSLTIAHRPGEWRAAWTRVTAYGDAARERTVSEPLPITDPEGAHTVQRFPTQKSGDRIDLRPLLADRPVVTRPELPLVVPADDEAQIFISTPIWLRAELPEPTRLLFEMPAIRLSDTWFGPDTRRGIVAYASPTSARLHVANLEVPSPHRAVTRVTVRNQTDAALPLERLSIPAPSLTLFADAEGGLWTASLLVEKERASGPARVSLETELPPEAGDATIVAPPREPDERNVLSRALHVLIG